MPTTTKMGIVYPASTDLVKDGATAMGTISTTVDAKSGLVLLNTTSFSAVSSQSINSVFTSNFTNYLILIDLVPATGAGLSFKLRASGSDTSTGYNRQVVYGDASTPAAERTTNQTSYDLFGTTSSQRTAIQMVLFRPNVAGTTGGIVHAAKAYDSSAPVIGMKTFGQTGSTQFDGFSIIAASSTITGKVSTYGINE